MLWKDCSTSYKMPVGLHSKKGYRKSLRTVVQRHNNGVYPRVIKVDGDGTMRSQKSLRFYAKKNIHWERPEPYVHSTNARSESGLLSLPSNERVF
mmetsp:Transcript_29499/g.46270  ORF Transcript_29499/g.46270 Transcript_29499/m.46270 type:complete len:95 (-) Transcript_29499:808-1092(-)